MAYQPDDDRFYDSLNRAGQTYLDQRGKVAEDQAATTREIGALGAQALTGTVNGAMTGAQWAQNRAAQQQKMDLAQTSEQRAQQKFTEDQQDAQHQRDIQARQEAFEGAPAEESFATGAGVEYHPGMTHQDVERMAGANHLGFEGKKLTSEEQRAKDTLAGENARAQAAQGGEASRSQAGIQAAADRQRELLAFDREKLASEEKREGMKLSAVKPKEPPAETLNKLSDADAAQKSLDALAEEYKGKTGKFSGVMQFVPGTDAAKFDDAINVHAQNIASFLKGGRGSATPGDIEYAKGMLPTAGDSTERAKEKLERLSQEVADRKKEHAHALQSAGFNIGDLGVDATGVGKKYNLKDKTTPDQAVASPTGGFPRKVMKGNVSATVSSPAELEEARAEGFQ